MKGAALAFLVRLATGVRLAEHLRLAEGGAGLLCESFLASGLCGDLGGAAGGVAGEGATGGGGGVLGIRTAAAVVGVEGVPCGADPPGPGADEGGASD